MLFKVKVGGTLGVAVVTWGGAVAVIVSVAEIG